MVTYGNLNENSFNKILMCEKRKRFMEYINSVIQNKLNSDITSVICDQNYKYDSFNLLQKCIINQVIKDKNAKISNILIEKPWE